MKAAIALFTLLFVAACSEPEPPTPPSEPPAPTVDLDAALVERAGAPLFDGLGSHHHAITTADPGAQRYFDQGMILAFAFNHAESIRSFRAAQTLDPTCAMCFWGESLATGPNINVTSNGKAVMSADDRVKAFAALQKALELRGNASEAEQDYIDALAKRYDGNPETPRPPLDMDYAVAMGDVVAKYPEDNDAAAMYAEALMNTMPWNYWAEDGNPRPDTVKVISSLERVLASDPNHPLAIHLYIHAVEASSAPERAEAPADRLATLVPGAGHLVHMPAHIYWRVGRYHDASAANIRAAKVDEDYIAQCNAQGFYPALYYPHNIHFLWAASTMEGRSKLSIESALKVVKNVTLAQVDQFPTVEVFRTIPLLSYVRFGKWDEILNYQPEPEKYKFSNGILHYARGVALAAKGDFDAARAEYNLLAPMKKEVSIHFLDSNDMPATTLLRIAEELLQGEIAYFSRDYPKAIGHYEEAVALQDSLPYTEPPFWYYPTRQSLGNALLDSKQFPEAESVYRKDLEQYPHHGWSMFGLAKALEAQGKNDEAAKQMEMFNHLWQDADVELNGSRI